MVIMKSTKVQTLGAYESVCACSEVANSTPTTDCATTERRGLWGVSFVKVPLSRCKRRFPIHRECNATLGLCTEVLTQRVERVRVRGRLRYVVNGARDAKIYIYISSACSYM